MGQVRLNETLVVLILIAVSSLTIRLLMAYDFHRSALLYVGVPFLISLALSTFTRQARGGPRGGNWYLKYWNMFRASLIVMLGSSVVLFEGFICVVMFMPIYFGVVLAGMCVEYVWRATIGKSHGKVTAHLLPVLLLCASLEGVHPILSTDRQEWVQYTAPVELSAREAIAALRLSIHSREPLPGFLRLFPMPYRVHADSFQPGAVHIASFRYHRWFVTNTHEGRLVLRVTSADRAHVEAQVLSDSSYFANYLKLESMRIEFDEMAPARTRITVTIRYERLLDPSWYFKPLQRYAIEAMAARFVTLMVNHHERFEAGA